MMQLFVRIILFFVISILLFGMVRWLPGDPATAYTRASYLQETPEYLAKLRGGMGLDKPFFAQWIAWWKGLLRGNWGNSWHTNQPYQSELLAAIGHTSIISVQAFLLAFLLALPLSIMAARAHQSALGQWISALSRFVSSAPPMVVALLLVLLFSIFLSWLPVQGARSWYHSILPSVTLAAGICSTFILLLRESLIECARHESVTYARVSGVPEMIIWYRYILRRAMAPFLAWSGIQLANLLCGAFIVEYWFAWPGFGRYFLNAVEYRDYPVIQTCMLLMAVFFTLSNGGTEWWRRRLEKHNRIDTNSSLPS
jgi:nickel transport system permease protein